MTPPPSPPRRRLVAADPDARSLRWGWILWAIGTAVLIVAGVGAPPERLPLMVVLAAALLLWPLWRGGRRVIHAVLDSAHAPWQGVYYEFDGRQIRILTDDTEALWFCAADVFEALEIGAGGRDPARARLAAGRDGLRHAPGTRMLCFTEHGLGAAGGDFRALAADPGDRPASPQAGTGRPFCANANPRRMIPADSGRGGVT